jgi:hypothetical protein
MRAYFGVRLTNPWLMAQKKMYFSGYILSVQPFFFSNFLGLTVEISSFKLVISHKLSRMDVIKFVITKEMYFGTEV